MHERGEEVHDKDSGASSTGRGLLTKQVAMVEMKIGSRDSGSREVDDGRGVSTMG